MRDLLTISHSFHTVDDFHRRESARLCSLTRRLKDRYPRLLDSCGTERVLLALSVACALTRLAKEGNVAVFEHIDEALSPPESMGCVMMPPWGCVMVEGTPFVFTDSEAMVRHFMWDVFTISIEIEGAANIAQVFFDLAGQRQWNAYAVMQEESLSEERRGKSEESKCLSEESLSEERRVKSEETTFAGRRERQSNSLREESLSEEVRTKSEESKCLSEELRVKNEESKCLSEELRVKNEESKCLSEELRVKNEESKCLSEELRVKNEESKCLSEELRVKNEESKCLREEFSCGRKEENIQKEDSEEPCFSARRHLDSSLFPLHSSLSQEDSSLFPLHSSLKLLDSSLFTLNSSLPQEDPYAALVDTVMQMDNEAREGFATLLDRHCVEAVGGSRLRAAEQARRLHYLIERSKDREQYEQTLKMKQKGTQTMGDTYTFHVQGDYVKGDKVMGNKYVGGACQQGEEERIKAALDRLMEERVADGSYLFHQQVQWYAVYRILVDYWGWRDGALADFCRRINAMGTKWRVACKIDGVKKINQTPPFFKAFSEWEETGNVATYTRQQSVARRFRELMEGSE